MYRLPKVPLLSSVLLLAAACASAQVPQGTTAPFAEGARALGMGGAFTAVADDMYSPFWNPAGAATLHGYHVVAFDAQGRLTGPLTVKDLTNNFPTSTGSQIALAEKVSSGISTLTASGDFAVGHNGFIFSIAPLAVGTITPRSANGSIGFALNGSIPSAGSSATFDGTVGGEAVLTYGRYVAPTTAVGLNFKVISVETATASVLYDGLTSNPVTTKSSTPQSTSTTMAMDFGVLQQISKYGHVGAMWQNFVGQDNQGVNPDRVSIGWSDRPFCRNVLLAANFDDIGGAGTGRLNFGTELSWGHLAVRAGLYHGQPTGGFGFGQFFNIAIGSGGTMAGIHLGF